MAASKKIGFFWGEEKITVVEFEKNSPNKIVSSPLGSKTTNPSPFSSNLTEEIQITAILQKLLQDNQIAGASFYVSLPMKETILRSFIIPFVKPEDIQSAVKFEAKKYMPFDIQDLSFVFYTIPFAEDKNKRLQVVFFAARKEVLDRYERIFKQVNSSISYCEPYMVSLSKALLFKKEIKPTDHLAFLVLDKNFGCISFIDQGIPQFIREFPISIPSQSEETNESIDALNLKIVNEVGNSFDFYARQFNGERIEQMLVSSEFVQKNLLDTLETELKVKIRKFSAVINTGVLGSSNDLDAIYALGACVAPPIESLSVFNFIGDNKPKSIFQKNIFSTLLLYKELMLVFFFCVGAVVLAFGFFQYQSKVSQKQYEQLTFKEGAFLHETLEGIKGEIQLNTDKLNQYKGIRTRSDVALILLRVASHLPEGALLNSLNVNYSMNDSTVNIDMKGDVFKEDPNEQIAVVNQVFSDIKNDKVLLQFIKKVSLVSLNREQFQGHQVTGFNIHCS